MTNPAPPADYAYRHVDPAWDTSPVDGRYFLSHLVGHLDLVIVHQELLHAAMPKRLAGGRDILPERKATAALLQEWHEAGVALRFGDGLLEVRKPQHLRLAALDEDMMMPRDGLERALRWTGRGTAELYRKEARALQRLLMVFHDG